MTSARLAGGVAPQAGCAAFATATARLTSAAPPQRNLRRHTAPVAGL